MSKELKMPSVNEVLIAGNVVNDPDFKAVGSSHRLTFRIAYNHRFQRNGEWEEESSFFTVTMWGKPAEYAQQRISQGVPVLVSGRLRSYEYEREGKRVFAQEIVSHRVQTLSKTGQGGDNSNNYSQEEALAF